MALDLICLGEAMVEFNHRPDDSIEQGFGGDTSNCAIAAARQGARVGFLSAVGDDEHGRALRALWQREGIDTEHVLIDPQHATGHYTITHDGDGHVFSYARAGSAASHLQASSLHEDYISRARILHVSGISQAISATASDAVRRAIAIAREHGVRVCYDTNLRLKLWPLADARRTIHAALADADIALPGLEDAIALIGESDPERIVEFYRSMGPRLVVLTLGADGVLLSDGTSRVHIPPFEVDARDATAAGDTFDGAFLARLLQGETPEAAARYANAAAALAVTRFGAVASIPTAEEVEAFLAARNAQMS